MRRNKTVSIVGGGFGGVYTAKYLLRSGFRVTLINERNYFIFTPMLHEVATGGLGTSDIVFEFQGFFNNDLFNFVRGRADDIDTVNNIVTVGKTKIHTDYIVIATGAQTNTKEIIGMENAFTLKNLDDALKIKKAIIGHMQGTDHQVSISVVGAGPTGIELMFEIEQFVQALQKNSHCSRYELRLLNHSNLLLKQFPEKIQTYAQNLITASSISLLQNTKVQEITPDTLITNQGDYKSNITIVAPGVVPQIDCLDQSHIHSGHVCVEATLQLESATTVFALGDIISLNGEPTPKLAQAAVDQAHVVAENITRLADSRSDLVQYVPHLKGMLISFGFRKGAGVVRGFVIKGIIAWWLWRTVYLFKIPGIQNKVRVAFSWTLNLFTKRSLVE